MSNSIRFDQRVAIVTGAGNGLGRDYALELSRRGAKVVVNDLGGSGSGEGQSNSAADLVVEQIRSEGGDAVASYASVANQEGGHSIVETALETYGKVDICICNAGFLRNNRFEDINEAQLNAILDVHLKGSFYVAQAAYREMRKHGYGRFLFTGSASGMYGHAWQANYAAAKAGVFGLSNVVAIEGAQYGINSNVILPTAASRLANEMGEGYTEITAFAESQKNADYSASEDRVTTPMNMPLAVYLVSEQCQSTHGVYSSNSGRYARVYINVSEGWVAPWGGTPPTVEEVAANFEIVCDNTHLYEPLTVYEEFTDVAKAARKQGVLRS